MHSCACAFIRAFMRVGMRGRACPQACDPTAYEAMEHSGIVEVRVPDRTIPGSRDFTVCHITECNSKGRNGRSGE